MYHHHEFPEKYSKWHALLVSFNTSGRKFPDQVPRIPDDKPARSRSPWPPAKTIVLPARGQSGTLGIATIPRLSPTQDLSLKNGDDPPEGTKAMKLRNFCIKLVTQ